ncbi:hypothetical protein BCON_0083g00260 [Botryotinia convoluta]|uniref:Uncharacterized protein n=1 Tax=Botryotinia convoluta TaxID=54673 RepID=A0A4Z1I5R2_9HELO|nr:hypothetical protein BCON_0083g00260 [Botryotinia convoluta]
MTSSINLPTSDIVRSSPSYAPSEDNAPFIHWREKFHLKIQLMHWKRENKSWNFIVDEFAKKGIRRKNTSCWYSYYNRTLKEMNHLKDAVQADIVHKYKRLGESTLDPYMRQADYGGCWERISALMEMHCSRWTPARVKYAWTHGAADLFPELVLSS